MKFVGVFAGASGIHYGPKTVSGGFTYDCRYIGTGTYSINEHGKVFNLCHDLMSCFGETGEMLFVWVPVKTRLVDDDGLP